MITVAGAAGLAARRVGAWRALSLGLSSRLFLRANPVSQRTTEVDAVRDAIFATHKDSFVVVVGPKGVGKTCIVETATQKTFGVVTVSVEPAQTLKEIEAEVLQAITRRSVRTIDEQKSSAKRVLDWHGFFFRRPATVVLSAVERSATGTYAHVDSAAKDLAHRYKVHVVIDASHNSLPEGALKTMREEVIDVLPMPRALLEEIPELQELLAALTAAKLADVVWACVGGVPALYLKLRKLWATARIKNPSASLEAIVEPFLKKLLLDAIKNRKDAVVADKRGHKRLAELYTLFREHSEVADFELEKMDVQRPSPDKVLRLVSKPLPSGRDRLFLVPADAPTAVVLRCGLQDALPLWELKELLRKEGLLQEAVSKPAEPSV